MNFIVCIKKVTATNKAIIGEKTVAINRLGIVSEMNPFDLFALETGLSLKEKYAGRVAVINIGPPMATEVVKEAIDIGADSGCVVSDRALVGSDVLATSYTISQGIQAKSNYDGIVLCGQQTTDGDTAQVGAEFAEFLGFDHAYFVNSVEDFADCAIQNSVELEQKIPQRNINCPCVLIISRDTDTPLLLSYNRKCKYGCEDIEIINLQDFDDKDKSHYCLDSPHKSRKDFTSR